MEVTLELIPQDGRLGPMQIMHWAVRVGSLCYEFERNGVQIGPSTTCDHGFEIETRRLGVTNKSHEEITAWARQFDETHSYSVAGSDFGGRNCQCFVRELCRVLGVGTSQLPMTQARQVEAAGVVYFLPLGALVVGGAILCKHLANSNDDGEIQWMWEDAGIIPAAARLNPGRRSRKQSVQATIKDLEAHLGTSNEKRPVRLFGRARGGLQKPTVAAAIAHLRELREAP